MSIDYFDHIRVAQPTDKIYSRLKYSKLRTKMTDDQKDELDGYLVQADALLEIKGAAVRMALQEKTKEKVVLADGNILCSRDLSQFLSECDEVLIMGATGGKKIMEAIRQKSSGEDMMGAIVYDAAASEMVDDALAWIMNYYNQQLRRENRHLTRLRYSPGYGDFPLENQEIMYNVLGLERLDISLTETCILDPEKSVTAIAGIKKVKNKS